MRQKTQSPLTILYLREGYSCGACEKLAYLFSRRLGIILIQQRRPGARLPWAAGSFRLGGSHLGPGLCFSSPSAGCPPPAVCPSHQHRLCSRLSLCSLLVGRCEQTSCRGYPVAPSLPTPQKWTHRPQRSSVSSSLSFPLSSPFLPSSLLYQTQVSISTAVGISDFRSANKLAAFPALHSVWDPQGISSGTLPAQPKERKEGIRVTKHSNTLTLTQDPHTSAVSGGPS